MGVRLLRGEADEILDQIIGILRQYEADHPGASVDLYRQNSVSVRIRIVDPAFRGMSRVERNDQVWRYLALLPEESQQDISMLVLLDGSEKGKSFSNMEFEDPVPSAL